MTTLHWALLGAGIAVVALVYLYSLRDDGMYWREEQEKKRRERDQLDLWGDLPAAGQIDEFGVGKPRTVKIEPTLDVADKVAERLEANRRETASAASAAAVRTTSGLPDARSTAASSQARPATVDENGDRQSPTAISASVPSSAARRAAGSTSTAASKTHTAAEIGGATESGATASHGASDASGATAASRSSSSATRSATSQSDAAASQPAADAYPSQKVVLFYLAEQEGTHILGPTLHAALEECDLVYGRRRIYHRIADQQAGDREVFSVASLLEPGTLDPSEAAGFSTPGISVFMVLPGPVDPLESYRDMIQTIGVLAERLNAQVLDSDRQPVTRDSAARLHAEITAQFYAESV